MEVARERRYAWVLEPAIRAGRPGRLAGPVDAVLALETIGLVAYDERRAERTRELVCQTRWFPGPTFRQLALRPLPAGERCLHGGVSGVVAVRALGDLDHDDRPVVDHRYHIDLEPQGRDGEGELSSLVTA